ncbi:MAG TPA: DUF6456 domain-containing protein [Allosphingosinicella sp.]
MGVEKKKRNRLLAERPLPSDGRERTTKGRLSRAVRSVTVNLAEAPLGWLRSRGHISERQFAAGEKLREDWELAQLSPRVTMRWDASPPGSRRSGAAIADKSDRKIAAQRRFEAAADEVGPGLKDILWRIVCAGEGMRDAETALGWPARSGKLVLAMALDRLADHYRLR